MKCIRIAAVSILVLFSAVVLAGQTYTQEQVKKDLKTLYKTLPEAHYDAFAYTSEAHFNQTFESLLGSVKNDHYSELDVIGLYQQLVSSLDNGHTEIDFPVGPYVEYAQAGGTVFPLEIAFEHGKPLVRKNFSAQDIQPGSEVISINGVPFVDIAARIYPHVSAEREYFKQAKIEVYSFPRYYWQVFGQQDSFVVSLRSGNTMTIHTLSAVDVFSGYESKREEVLNANMTLTFYPQAAYINPGNFSGDEQAYRAFIDDAFKQIKLNNSHNLIIDLRNNGGGNDSFSDYLVAYLADKPFKWNSHFSLKTSAVLKADTLKNRDTSDPYWQDVLKHENGERYRYDFDAYQPRPSAERFNGKVFVLVNRQSHSQSAVTAAQIQDYGWGTIVGEETGDYPSLYASQFHYALPETGIVVKISKGRIVRVNGSEKQEGVIPDIAIKDHLVDEHDEILDALLMQLKPDIGSAP